MTLQQFAGLFDLRPVWARVGGRSFALTVFFAITGFILALTGKLTPEYAGLVTALQGFHVGRAIMQDRQPPAGGSSDA